MTIEQYAREIAEAVMVEVRYIAKDAYREFPWDNLDAIIASVPKPDVQAQDHHLVITSTEDVQAQIDAARAEEREACAQLVAAGWRLGVSSEDTASDLACQIRARGGARGEA